jgi:calcineurin-like phosphoesterase family protein
MSTYFTSDHHFGHAGALGLYRRPFESVAETDRQMIGRWNSVVRPEDEVWHLGDFAIRQRPERVASLLKTLHGRKHLIAGNNDDAAVNGCDGWESVQAYAEVSVDGMHLVSCVTIPSGPGGIWAKVGPICMAIVTAA